MPLVATALLAYIAGLLAGFGAPPFILGAVALSMALSAFALVRRSRLLAGLGLALAAGVVVADAVERLDARCAREVRVARHWQVWLDDDAFPGGLTRATVHDCPVSLTLVVRQGRAQRGSLATVSGEPVFGRQRLLVQEASVRLERPAPLLVRWRIRAERAVDATFERDAPIARALLVADMKQLSPDVRDRFAASGLAHVLSISGLHVGIIALALEIVFGAMRLPRVVASTSSLAVTTVYVLILGAPPPAVRAATMLGARTLSRTMQRPTSPWAIVALGAATPLISPRAVLDLGWQLSVLGVAALVVVPGIVRRILPHDVLGWRRDLASGLIASTVATCLSAPLVAWHFGRVSAIGPLTNIVASPFVTLVQPILFAGLVLAPFGGVARFLAGAAHPLLVGLDTTARVGASVPFAQLVVRPTPIEALLGALLVVALLAVLSGWRALRCLVVAGTAAALMLWLPWLERSTGNIEVHMIDVGQGDAIALRTPRGRWVLFDAGGAWTKSDAGKSTVVPYLARRGGEVVAFVLSHPHTDHVGGAASVLAATHPSLYLDAAFAAGNDAYRASLRVAAEQRVAWRRVHPGDSIVVDGVVLSLLAPDSVWTAGLVDPNLASTIVVARFGTRRFLFTGDAEAAEERWVLEHAGASLRADVLKVGHHGSSTSSTGPFLDAVHPRLALVSVGAGNLYGHPSAAVLRALAAHGAKVLRTDVLGTIVVSSDGLRLWVEADGETWDVP